MMKKMMFLTGIALALLSCDSGSKSSETVSDGKSTKSSGNTYACLEPFQDDYSLLLTTEEMNAVYPIDFENAKQDLSTGSYGNHTYAWDSDRPSFVMEISGMKMDIPDQNLIGVKMLSFVSEDSDLKSAVGTFDMAYKELSDEELKRINENLAKENDEIKKTGEEMMKVRGKSSWDFVEGLGSSAWFKWNDQYGGDLAVMAGRAKFNIVIKVNDNPADNRKLAVKLAEKILAKCE